ncbi:MAG: TonB-dependent receptor, partial [Bacteroidetes bacterium]|nr:TonB-dependent receptor [Bacteroidota bacterium]
MKISTTLILFIFSIGYSYSQTKATVSGNVYEKGSKENLPNVNISVLGANITTTSNAYGFYSVTLPVGTHVLKFSFIGFESVVDTIVLLKNIDLDIDLKPSSTELKGAVVKGEKKQKVSETPQMSNINIPVQAVKDIPALLGEKDVLKVIQLMPGVQKGSEGQSGIYVRGGGPDQNLIILDDAPVYNAFHLFGFFSLFNGDALKSIELIKGGFPARYGGRLSSVIDMQMKDGNKAKLKGEGGLGVIASRLVLEGPLFPKKLKNKSSFLISGRSTYINLMMRPIIRASSDGLNDGGYNFYDLNAKFNYEIDKNNKIYLSGYFGRDKFFFQENSAAPSKDYFRGGFLWGNATGTLRWNHKYNSKWFSNTSLIFSDYKFEIFAKIKEANETFDLNFKSGIRDFGIKNDNDYIYSPEHHIKFGAITTYHQFRPSATVIKSSSNPSENTRSINTIRTAESGFYIEDLWKV